MSEKLRMVKRRIKEAALVVRYTAPDPRRPSVPLSPRAAGWLETLRRDGIVRVDAEHAGTLAAHLDRVYYAALDRLGMPPRVDGAALGGEGRFLVQRPVPQMEELKASGLGREDQYLVSMKDAAVEKLLLDPDIVGLFYDYFRRQPYYRNQPILDRFHLEPAAVPPDILHAYHVDHLRQMSGMLLLSDVTTRSTRMQYLVGSHRRSLIRHGIYFDRERCDALVAEQPEKVLDLVGPPGTLYIFDASGIHRRHAVAGSTRKMFHWNVTTGHHLQPFEDTVDAWPALEKAPDYVRKAFGGRRDTDRSAY